MHAHRKRQGSIFRGGRRRCELRSLHAKLDAKPSQVEEWRQLAVDAVIENKIELALLENALAVSETSLSLAFPQRGGHICRCGNQGDGHGGQGQV